AMISVATPKTTAMAFDRLAADYDAAFTNSSVGKAQRTAVWECAKNILTPYSRLLELNCGTGEDAIHFAQEGFDITACDVSPAMVAQARKKAVSTDSCDRIRFYVQATETISKLPVRYPFAGAFSNFSGLNCIKDLGGLAKALAPMLLPGSPVLFCFSTRYCLWEIAWYLLHADLSRSSRRWGGYHETTLGGVTLPVYYPTCEQIVRSFTHDFRLVGVYGIGITVPPSYVDPWIAGHPKLLQFLRKIDAAVRRVPGIRVLGDHMLLHLERLHT
ncbi:MAG TPA: methyltransferase domain-containing protein, partial [Acidobacteriaceae bacterium]